MGENLSETSQTDQASRIIPEVFREPWVARGSQPNYFVPITVPDSDPTDGDQFSLCFNAEWLPIVLGSLKLLTQQETWVGDDQAAIDLAVQRANLLLDQWMEGCTPPLMFRQILPCVLEFSEDGGTTWSEIFDAQECIDENLEDGTIGPGAGSALRGPHEPGFCSTQHFSFEVQRRWVSGIPVNTGDVITLSNVKGGTWENFIDFTTMHCASGILGIPDICAGVADPGQGSDPLPDSNHDRVIGKIGSSFYDLLDAPLTVPSSIENQAFVLQINNSDFEDFWGIISGDVQICRAGWTHVFDFKTGQHGWTIFGGLGEWVSSVGFRATVVGGQVELRVCLDGFTATTMFTGTAVISYTDLFTSDADLVRGFSGDCTTLGSQLWSIDGTDGDHDNATDEQVSGSFSPTSTPCLLLSLDAHGSGPAIISKFTVSGLGSDPF